MPDTLPSAVLPVVPRRRGGFTLVELLVVIAIIALLVAILLPVLARARRKAVVLASPVAYIGADNALRLTDARGGIESFLGRTAHQSCPVCHSPPAWSPSGSTLAFRLEDGAMGAAPQYALLTPFTGRLVRPRPGIGTHFLGWAREGEWVETDRQALYVRAEATAHPRPLTPQRMPLSISPAPASAPGPYVAGLSHQGRSTIAFLRKDYSVAKRVWEENGGFSGAFNQDPRCDATADYVAWTQRRGSSSDGSVVAMKHVSEPPTTLPTILGRQYESASFCDWTDEGHLLVNVRLRSVRQLVVLDRKGKLVRTLSLATPPADGVVAAYRRYMHR